MELTITRPDDWHLHLRDGELLQAVVPHRLIFFDNANTSIYFLLQAIVLF